MTSAVLVAVGLMLCVAAEMQTSQNALLERLADFSDSLAVLRTDRFGADDASLLDAFDDSRRLTDALVDAVEAEEDAIVRTHLTAAANANEGIQGVLADLQELRPVWRELRLEDYDIVGGVLRSRDIDGIVDVEVRDAFDVIMGKVEDLRYAVDGMAAFLEDAAMEKMIDSEIAGKMLLDSVQGGLRRLLSELRPVKQLRDRLGGLGLRTLHDGLIDATEAPLIATDGLLHRGGKMLRGSKHSTVDDATSRIRSAVRDRMDHIEDFGVGEDLLDDVEDETHRLRKRLGDSLHDADDIIDGDIFDGRVRSIGGKIRSHGGVRRIVHDIIE